MSDVLLEMDSAADSWAGLLDAGLKLIDTFTAAQAGNGGEPSDGSAPTIESDPRTGRSYVKLPIPEADKVRRVTEALSDLIANLRR